MSDRIQHQLSDRLSTLRQMDHAILAAKSLPKIAEETLFYLGKLVPCDWASFVVYDLKTGDAREIASRIGGEARTGEDVWIPAEELGPAAELEQGARVLIEDLRKLDHRSPAQDRLLEAGLRCYLSVPILAARELIASLNWAMAAPGAIELEHEELTAEAAGSLAIALQNAQLFEAERSRRQEAETLREITMALASTLDLDNVLEAILANLDQVIPFDSARVFLMEDERLRPVAGRGPSTSYAIGPTHSANDLLFREIQQSKSPVILEDASLDARFSGWEGLDATRGWMGVPLMVRGAVIGCLTLDNRRVAAYNEAMASLAQAFANQAAVAIQNAQLFEQIRAGRERLRSLSHRLVEVQEAQRRDIARELHDQIGQALTGLKLILEMSVRTPDQTLEANLLEALGLVNELMTQVRELSLDLRPAMLDDLGLIPALLWHFERYTAQTRVNVQFRHTGLEDRRFRPEIETAAYRIVQEALTNVARHAQTDTVVVRIWADENMVSLQIEDHGRGFNTEAKLDAGESSGLSGMLERAVLLGGQLSIESRDEYGTLLIADLPLEGRIERRKRDRAAW